MSRKWIFEWILIDCETLNFLPKCTPLTSILYGQYFGEPYDILSLNLKPKIYIYNYPWIKCKMLQVEVILPPFYTFTHNLKFSAKTILMSSFWTRRDCNSPTMSLSQIISRVRFGYGYGVVAKLNPEYDLVTKAVAKLYTRLC